MDGYAVMVSVNGGLAKFDQTVSAPQATIGGNVGDEVQILVIGYVVNGGNRVMSPASAYSEMIRFSELGDEPPPPPGGDDPALDPNLTWLRLWNAATGEMRLWGIDGLDVFEDRAFVQIPAGRVLRATCDFDGDGDEDLLVQALGSGDFEVLWIEGAAFAGSADIGSPPNGWELNDCGRLDGNQTADLVWVVGDEIHAWLFRSNARTSSTEIATVPSDWALLGAQDLDGDGDDDLLFGSSGAVEGILIEDGAMVDEGMISDMPNWQRYSETQSGDFSGDGREDVVWRYTQSGGERFRMWLLNGLTREARKDVQGDAAGLEIAAVSDLDGNGTDDWVVRSGNRLEGFLMSAQVIVDRDVLGSLGSSWIPLEGPTVLP